MPAPASATPPSAARPNGAPPMPPPPPPPPLPGPGGKAPPPPPPPPPRSGTHASAALKTDVPDGGAEGIAKSWEVIEQFRALNRMAAGPKKASRRAAAGDGRDGGPHEEQDAGGDMAPGAAARGGVGQESSSGARVARGGAGAAHEVHQELQAKSSYMRKVRTCC